MPITKKIALLSFTAAAFTFTTAADINNNDRNQEPLTGNSLFLQDKLSIGIAFGVLNVKAQEYVFNEDSGTQLSRLIWHTKASPIAKLSLAYQITPRSSVNANLWAVSPQKNSSLDDYDYADFTNPGHRTNWSHHEDTKLKANGFDLYLKYRFTPENKPYRLAFLGGLHNSRFQWIAPARGFYDYEASIIDSAYTGYDNSPGLGASYKQWFRTPYLGLSGGFNYKKLSIDADLKISSFVQAKILDIHHRRQILFPEKPVTKPKFYSLDLNLIYPLTAQLSVNGQAGIAYIPKTKTNTGMEFMGYPEEKFYTPGGGGLKNLTKTLSLGLKYNF